MMKLASVRSGWQGSRFNGHAMLQRNMIESGGACGPRQLAILKTKSDVMAGMEQARLLNRICTRERIHAIRSHAKRLEN
jgi:hypothetical protein